MLFLSAAHFGTLILEVNTERKQVTQSIDLNSKSMMQTVQEIIVFYCTKATLSDNVLHIRQQKFLRSMRYLSLQIQIL